MRQRLSLWLVSVLLLLPGLAMADGVPKTGAPYQIFKTSAVLTTSGQILAGPGYVYALICIGNDPAAQAATLTLYDNTAGSGTAVIVWAVQAVAYSYPVILPVKRIMATGAYLLYSATADISCYAQYQ